MNGIRGSGSIPSESFHVQEQKTSKKGDKVSDLFSKVKSLFKTGKDIKPSKIIKASSEKSDKTNLNELTEELFGTTIDFKSDNLIDAIKTNILDKMGYSEKGHFKNIENIKDLLETEGGLDAVVSLLKRQIEAFKIQGEAVGQLFNIVDQSQQQNLVLKQEQFREKLIKDSTHNKSEPTEVKDAKGKSVKFIFKMLQTEGKDGKKRLSYSGTHTRVREHSNNIM